MFHLSACCCGTLVEPCETCSIECATSSGATTYDPPLALPEYLELDLTLTPGLPDCCGGEWASGCWLLRNASTFVTGGNCDVYYAVDPANPTQRLWARKGFSYDGTTSETCVEGDSDQPNLIAVLVTGTSNGITSAVTGLILDFNVSDFAESYPGLVRGGLMRYDYEAPPGGVNLCTAGLVTLLKDASSELTCAGVTAEDYWPANVTLTVVECDSTIPACLRTPLCIEDTPCFPNIEASNLFVDIELGDGTVFRICMACQENLGWYGLFTASHDTCGEVSGSAEIECDGTQWKLRITVASVTEEYDLTVNTGGFSGYFAGTNSNICTSSTSINGTVNACLEPTVLCCPEWACCPPKVLFADVTDNFGSGTLTVVLEGDSGGVFGGSGDMPVASLICSPMPTTKPISLNLECVDGQWELTITSSNDSATGTASSFECEPVEIDFAGLALTPGTGCTEVTYAVSVTG